MRGSSDRKAPGGYPTTYVVHADPDWCQRITEQFTERSDLRNGVFTDLACWGCAYTLVVQQHWFATGSGAIGGGAAQFLRADRGTGTFRTNSMGF
ncbi:MAG: hypothetical protein IPL64_08435 [Flavobacteriales bacterium]|nr:hypothetical protein [Flavobacteriales bacterium]